jgi:hypothetical protein
MRLNEQRLRIARDLLAALETRKWYRYGRGAPTGSQPLDFLDPDCRWWYRDVPGVRVNSIPLQFVAELRFVAEQLADQARRNAASALGVKGPAREPSAASPARTSGHVPPDIQYSLTGLLRTPSVRKAWRARLPGTTEVVRDINQTPRTRPSIGASDWTRQSRWAILATAFDYAVGCFLAQSNIESVFARVGEVADAHTSIAPVCTVLPALLERQLKGAGRDGGRFDRRDTLRTLLLIAEVDVVYRKRSTKPICRARPARAGRPARITLPGR